MIKKKQKPHSSARKKASPSTLPRAQKVAAKASKSAPKSSAAKRKVEQSRQRKKLEELTLKMFQEVYEDYQQGKFHRIL